MPRNSVRPALATAASQCTPAWPSDMSALATDNASFWERHQLKFFRYGHIYASIYGQVIIDYVPQQPMSRPLKLLLTVYSHVFSLLLIVVIPCYFGYNYRALTVTNDRRMQLVLYVSFANTLIKYATVIVTYMANTFHFKAINHRCTMQRMHLDAALTTNYQGPRWPMEYFENFMYYKFFLINLMMITQVCGIFAVAGIDADGSHLRIYFAIYSFVLWNYAENMADFFYYINSCVLKYMRLLRVQLDEVLQLLQQMDTQTQLDAPPLRRGILMLNCCQLCDRICVLRGHFGEICMLYTESFRMHQFQLLGLMLTTLINNLTNFFTIFNLVATQSLSSVSYPIVVSVLYAMLFYLDTYIVTLVNEQIKVELTRLAITIRQFCDFPTLGPPSLDQELEHFSLLMMQYHAPMLCGLLHLDRRLIYLISVTAFSYFITLVQFDLYLRTSK